jgi:integrase
MARMKLTQRAVDGLRTPDPSGEQRLYWDTEMRGFGVLCSGTSDVKTYVVKGSVEGRGVRRTLGRANVLSLAEARLRAKEMMVSFYGGNDPKVKRAGNATLRLALEQYLAARQNLTRRSRDSYRETIHRYLASWLDRPLRSITRDMVEQRHRGIAEEIAASERSSGHAAANNAMRVLRALWNFTADRNADLGVSPVRLKGQWHHVHPRERHLGGSDLPAFYRAVMQLPSAVGRDYLLLLLFTGMRRREATSLRWADVDLIQKVIHVGAAKTKSRRKLDLPMTDFVFDLLVARRAVGKTEYVFPASSRSGHIEEPRYFLDQVAESGAARVSAHDLRRTFITVAESCDISPIALRALVNHSLGQDVTSGYIQMTAERLRLPAQKVSDRIKMLCGVAEPEGPKVARIR